MVRCGVDPDSAHASAFEICKAAGVYDKDGKLFGKWGGIVRAWLERMLPPNAAELCDGTVAITITRMWPVPRAVSVRNFRSRDELIGALVASTHIPWFMDGRCLSRAYRGMLEDDDTMSIV